MRWRGPSGRSRSSCLEAGWLRSLGFKSLALIAGTAAGGAGKLLRELLDVAEARAGVAAGVAPAGWAVCRWIPAQEVSASPAATAPSARERPLIGSGDYWADRASSPAARLEQDSWTPPRPPRCLPPPRR